MKGIDMLLLVLSHIIYIHIIRTHRQGSLALCQGVSKPWLILTATPKGGNFFIIIPFYS